jgi:hypothetical protein
MKRAGWLAVMMVVACSAAAAETDINTVVKLVEARYAVRHHGVPFLWLAKPFLLGSGVGGLKIATFENFQVPAEQQHALKEELEGALGPGWSPFVETRSKRNREWTMIYAHAEGRGMKMLIVTSEDNGEMTVLQMKVSGKKWFDEPVANARRQGREMAEEARERPPQ